MSVPISLLFPYRRLYSRHELQGSHLVTPTVAFNTFFFPPQDAYSGQCTVMFILVQIAMQAVYQEEISIHTLLHSFEVRFFLTLLERKTFYLNGTT